MQPTVQSEQDKMVPIDTSGDPVEIEVKEDDKKENDVQVEQEDQPEVSVQEEKKDEELEEYSQSVKRRIDKLTRKMREAERREQAATEFASNVQKENTDLKTKAQELDGSYIASEANRITAETEKAKNDLKIANENNDVEQHFRKTITSI